MEAQVKMKPVPEEEEPGKGAFRDLEAIEVKKKPDGITAIAEEEEEKDGHGLKNDVDVLDKELIMLAGRAAKRVRSRRTNLDISEEVEMNEDYKLLTKTISENTDTSTTTSASHTETTDDGDDDKVDSTSAAATTATATATTSIDKDYVNSDGDGVGLVVCEYKTEVLPTTPQSEEQEQSEEKEVEPLQKTHDYYDYISQVGLVLVKAWNGLHYFFVTILFLNCVHFAKHLYDLYYENQNQIPEQEQKSEVEVGKGEENLSENSSPKPKSDDDDSEETAVMSPNTLSIQNTQEAVVEQAQEAFALMAAAAGKGENEVVLKPEITIINAENEVIKNSPEKQEEDDVDSAVEVDRRDSVDSQISTTSSTQSGNLADADEDAGSEDGSGSGSISGSEMKKNEAPDSKEVAQRIINQVESMFSDEHLAKDGFLLKHVRRRSDGFVSLKLVAGLRKVKQITRDFPVVLNALKDSQKLEVNAEGTKVRRVEPLTNYLKTVPIKSKEKEGKDGASSNDENTQPQGQKENNQSAKSGSKPGKENRSQSRRNSGFQGQDQQNRNTGSNSRRNSNTNNRKSSNASTTSSNGGSRHNSFSKPPPLLQQSTTMHPADLFRNVYTMTAYSSNSNSSGSGEDCQSPQVVRRRGGSLPVSALQRHSTGNAFLSPNSSPPRNGHGQPSFYTLGPHGGARPKSNSYCEGAGPSTITMSPWLQRRKASASTRLSQGELVITEVIRQPRGPDGTKGFQPGYRTMIIEERLQQQKNSAVSA